MQIHHGYNASWACSTSPPPPRTLADGVGELIELQVHSGAAWEVGETLCLSDVVLHLLQVGEQRRLLRCPAVEFGLLHGDADRALLQCLLSHTERLQRRTGLSVFKLFISTLLLQRKMFHSFSSTLLHISTFSYIENLQYNFSPEKSI